MKIVILVHCIFLLIFESSQSFLSGNMGGKKFNTQYLYKKKYYPDLAPYPYPNDLNTNFNTGTVVQCTVHLVP
jgi:hypothetical protein